MATKQNIYRQAALILKESATTLAVTDDTVLVNTFSQAYDSAVKLVLENGKWNFAARSLSIEADEDTEPNFGYSFAFTKPDDYRNLIAMSGSATFWPPMDPNAYRDEGNFWFANFDPIYVSIVSDDPAFGGDLSLWPEVVARALEYELAFRAAPHVTTIGEEPFAQLEKRTKMALRRAQSWDAGKQPPDPPPQPRLSTARGGWHGRSSGGRPWWRGF